MYLVGRLHFLTLEKWPFVRDILRNPAVHFPLVAKTICSRGAPYVGCLGPSFVVADYSLVGVAGLQSVQLPGPALCRGCQLLVSGARSQGDWL